MALTTVGTLALLSAALSRRLPANGAAPSATSLARDALPVVPVSTSNSGLSTPVTQGRSIALDLL